MKPRPAITAPHEPERRAPSRLDASLLSTSRGGARRSHRAVPGHNARTVSGKFLSGLAAVCLAGLFGGCYSFSGAREEIRQNQEQEATINREIQKEQDRERELENSTNFPATNGPSK